MRTQLWIAVGLAGCGTTGSSQLSLFAQIDDRGDTASIAVVAQPDDQTETSVALDDASATLHVRGQSIALTGHRGQLVGDFALSPPATTDEQFSLDVTRDGTTATLALGAPPLIDLTAPLPLFVPRSQDLSLRWATASADPMDWQIGGTECFPAIEMNIDSGATELEIPSSTFGTDTSTRKTCGTALRLERKRASSTTNDGFAAAQLIYNRELDIPFASTP